MRKLHLNGTWQLRCASEEGESEWKNWIPARVPGTVHTDLLAAGLIPDPFVADNELRVQPVHLVDWIYRRQFEWLPTSSGRTLLICEGLDTVAQIRLNGALLAETENQFLTYRFDVTEHLREGENDLEILFRSPLRSAEERRERIGPLVRDYDKYDERRFYIRKAQYSFGWDWGPALPTSGIWRPIYLLNVDGPSIGDVWLRTLSVENDKVECEAMVEVEGGAEGCTLRFELVRDGLAVLRDGCAVTESVVRRDWVLSDVELWWPNGYGTPVLYELRVMLERNGKILDRIVRRVGFRTVELVLADDDGACFRFRVNGREIFVKGADWIPADSFIPRVSREKYRALLERAAAAHMNMLRVWGGGIYEDRAFYELCDELGLLVWQDFMFACGVYPETGDFLRLVEQEARQNVRRLRNHPSVALWCGNNECEWLWRQRTGRPVEEMPGFRIFHGLLPRVCSELDASRPYWPTSPWGDPEDPNGQTAGNRHQWEIWSRWRDYREVTQDTSLFVTEFGFQAPACQETLDRVLPVSERHPQSRMIEFHNKQVEGQERLFRFLAAHFRVQVSYPDFIYLTQVNQGEALKACVEHWRRRWPNTGGVLIWQLNDCWPVTSWSLIDGDLRQKAAYYYAKRFFAPTVVCLERSGSKIGIWVCNDRFEPFEGSVRWKVASFRGEIFCEQEQAVHTEAQCVRRVGTIDRSVCQDSGEETCYVAVLLLDASGTPVGRATDLLVEPKHARLVEPNIRIEDFETSHGGGQVTISSEAYAKAVYIRLPGADLEDNFFDLEPGERRVVGFRTVGETEPGTSGLTVSVVK